MAVNVLLGAISFAVVIFGAGTCYAGIGAAFDEEKKGDRTFNTGLIIMFAGLIAFGLNLGAAL